MTLDITVTDMFCGAGGSTTGATLAGATVRLAINHWKRAIETHTTNYPDVTHALTDLHTATPRRFPSTTMLIASPECSAHTLARGRKRKAQEQPELWEQGETDLGAEAEERSRCTMWTPLDWAEHHDYQAVILENVVDTHLWRPFMSWLQAWRSLGYDFELVYLNSMHAHPTPQSRDRMYFVAWKHGNRKPDLRITPPAYCAACGKDIKAVQSWKNPARRYGKYRQQYVYRCPRCAREVTPYYYAAANAIDWSLSAPRIGDRARPLREKTMQRIAYGLAKFAREPHAMPLNTTTGWERTPRQGVHPQPPGANGLAVMMPSCLAFIIPPPAPQGLVSSHFQPRPPMTIQGSPSHRHSSCTQCMGRRSIRAMEYPPVRSTRSRKPPVGVARSRSLSNIMTMREHAPSRRRFLPNGQTINITGRLCRPLSSITWGRTVRARSPGPSRRSVQRVIITAWSYLSAGS